MLNVVLALSVHDDLNDPVNATLHLTLQHQTLGTTHQATLTTGTTGLLLYQRPHTLTAGPTGINAPSEHHTTLQATANTRENTPNPPTNTDHAHQTYHAGP